MNGFFLPLLVFSPLLGMFILLFINKKQETLIKLIGICSTIPALLLSIFIWLQYRAGAKLSEFNVDVEWFRFGNFKEYDRQLFAVDIELGVDGLSLVMLMLTTILGILAAIASLRIKQEWKGYFLLLLLLQVGMLGVFASDNLILFFLFFEMTLVAMFFLVGKWGYIQKEKAAYSFLIYNGLGSAILLIVIMILFAKTGTSNITTLQQIIPHGGVTLVSHISDELKVGMLIAILIAFGIKLPIVPFHTWMLRVHVQAPPAIVMLHAGILLKIGAYGIIRFGMGIFPVQFKEISLYIVLIGIINFLYGALLALSQKDFKMVLAYSSVSHMGIVLAGLGVLNEAGLQGAIFQTVSHGLIAALLFFIVGVMAERTTTTELSELGGLAKSMPILSGFMLVGGMASLGLPGMSGFVSEFMVFLGLFQDYKLLGAIGALGLIVTAVYVLRAVLTITYGEAKLSIDKETADIRGTEWVPLLVLTSLIVLIGVYPAILTDILNETLNTISARMGG